MTTMYPAEVTCGLCLETGPQMVIGSTSSFGWMDLDLRPPPLARHTIDSEIQRCRFCGYCARDLEEGDPSLKPVVESDTYRSLLVSDLPEPANHYLCAALLADSSEERGLAGSFALRAAWVCDDAEDSASGIHCRNEALRYWSELRAGDTFAGDLLTQHCVRADALRRARRFEECIHLCDQTIPLVDEETLLKILEYERALAQMQDAGAHTVDEATGPSGTTL